MTVARICHSRMIGHQGNILVAFTRCDVNEAWFCFDTGVLCWTSIVCLQWKGTTLFHWGASWIAWELFSPPYCSLVFVPLHRISFFVVWLIFDRLGSFLKGSEYKSRALILVVKFRICYFFILEGSAVIVLCYIIGCVWVIEWVIVV